MLACLIQAELLPRIFNSRIHRPSKPQVGMRLNRRPPNITFRKKKTGGVAISSMVPLTHLDDKMVQRILQESWGCLWLGSRASRAAARGATTAAADSCSTNQPPPPSSPP